MLSLILRPLRYLAELMVTHDSPTQLALGFTLGALVGLLPKGNLIAVALCVLLCSVRVNKTAGCLGALAFLWVGVVTDPVAHKFGLQVLSLEPLQDLYASLYDMPLGPWLGFHNSVVMGSLLLGIYFSYPLFWLTYATCRIIRTRLTERARRHWIRQLVADMNIGAQWGSMS